MSDDLLPMDIITLPVGEAAPIDSDCISIDTAPDGFRLTGSLLARDESHAVVDGEIYGSYADAEAAGLSWAAGCGVTRLYVATDSPGPA
jgi:hypothetical protein